MNRDRLILLLAAPLIIAAGIARAACAAAPQAAREVRAAWGYFGRRSGPNFGPKTCPLVSIWPQSSGPAAVSGP